MLVTLKGIAIVFLTFQKASETELLKHSSVRAAKDSFFGREVDPLVGFPLKMIGKALTQRTADVKSEFLSTEA